MTWTRFFRARGTPSLSVPNLRRDSMLRVERLEDRTVPATFAFTPNALGGGNFNPFPGFTGRVETASGDVNGDGVADIITAEGPGPGSQSEVRIFDGASALRGQAVLVADFFPYAANTAGAGQTSGFGGGTFVTAGNFSGGRFEDLVTSTGAGGGGHVKVFNFQNPTTSAFLGSNPTLLTSYIVYLGYQGPVTVTTINRVSTLPPLLVTAPGAGTAADIRVFDNVASIGGVPVGTLVPPAAQLFAFPGFLGGVDIAGGGTPLNPLLFLAPSVDPPLISVLNVNTAGNGAVSLVQGPTFSTGIGAQTDIRLASADINGTGNLDALTSFAGLGPSAPIQVFSVANGVQTQLPSLAQFQGFDFFGNNWLAASAFTSPTTTTTTTAATTLAGAAVPGFQLLGPTSTGTPAGTPGTFSTAATPGTTDTTGTTGTSFVGTTGTFGTTGSTGITGLFGATGATGTTGTFGSPGALSATNTTGTLVSSFAGTPGTFGTP